MLGVGQASLLLRFEAGGLEPQQGRHCNVPNPRTDHTTARLRQPRRGGSQDQVKSLGLQFPHLERVRT